MTSIPSRKLSHSTSRNNNNNNNKPSPPPSSTSTPSPRAVIAPLPTTSTSTTSTSTPNVGDLTTLLNLPLRLTLIGDKGPTSPPRIIEGTLYTYDPTTSFLVLTTPSPSTLKSFPSTPSLHTAQNPLVSKRSYHLIKSSQLISVHILSLIPDLTIPTPNEALRSINSKELELKVEKAVREDQKERARIGGNGVTVEGQTLFDALEKTLPVRWSGTSIIVMDEVIINAPYATQDVKGSKGERVERVIKVLEGERRRLSIV